MSRSLLYLDDSSKLLCCRQYRFGLRTVSKRAVERKTSDREQRQSCHDVEQALGIERLENHGSEQRSEHSACRTRT